MRRGAVATVKTIAQQAASADEIVRAGESLGRMVGSVATAMAEQRVAAAEVAHSTALMRTQAEETAKALKEQTRAMRDMTGAAANTAKQVKGITQANRSHLQAVTALTGDLAEMRRITERNAGGVAETRDGTSDLLRNAQALTSVVSRQAKNAH